MGCCAEVMPRSKWKGPFVDASILRRLMQTHPEAGMKIYSRRSVIMSDFIGLKFQVHNGKSFIPIRVLPEMVGRKYALSYFCSLLAYDELVPGLANFPRLASRPTTMLTTKMPVENPQRPPMTK